MKNEKKIINCEKVGSQFSSEGVERKSGITRVPGASSTHQTRRSKTLVEPVSLFWFVGRTVVGSTSKMGACWCDRRKLKSECTDRISNRELDHARHL